MANFEGSMRLSRANASAFVDENEGDLIMVTGSDSQRILIGNTSDGSNYATLSLSSNAASVAGTVNAVDVSSHTVQTTDIYLTTYDPRNSNTLQVIEPYYQADTMTLNLATYASNASYYASNTASSVDPTISMYASNTSAWASNNAGGGASAVFSSNAAAFGSNLKIRVDLNSNVAFSASNAAFSATRTGGDASFSNLTLSGDIVPTQNQVQSIGTSNNRFSEAWVDSLHIATNTLYLGDTPVLGTNQNTIMVTADADQSINVKTTGTGSTLLTSVAGINMSTSGMNAQVLVQSTGVGGKVVFGATTGIDFTTPQAVFTCNASITGSLTAGSLMVNGNVVLNGSNFIANAQTVEVMDNIMVLNSGQVGTGVSAGQAGIRIDRGDGVDYLNVFDETAQMFQVGQLGALETIATRPWVAGNACVKSSNLSDLANALLARNNLGLGASCNVVFNDVAATSYTGLITTTSSTSTTVPASGSAVKAAFDAGAFASNSVRFGGALSNMSVVTSNLVVAGGTTSITGSTTFKSAVTVENSGSNATTGLNVTGNIVASGDVTAFSDRTIKADLQQLTGALEKLCSLTGYTYLRVDDGESEPLLRVRHMGLVAQEVQAVAPEAVLPTESGLLSVSYSGLMALVVEAVKQLTTRVQRIEDVASAPQ